MPHPNHEAQLSRLNRIEGQVRGIHGMVEEQRYCVDILTQLRAVRAALRRVEENILRDHVNQCVVAAVEGESKRESDKKVEELLDVISRFTK